MVGETDSKHCRCTVSVVNKQINKYYFKSHAVETSLVKCSITKRTPKWPQSNACGHKKPPEILSQVLYLRGVQENWEKGTEPYYLLLPHFASSIEGLLSVSCSEGPQAGDWETHR